MTAPLPGLAVVDEPGAGDGPVAFARGVLRRMQPRLLLLALGFIGASQVLGWLAWFRQTRFVLPDWHWKASLLTDLLIVASVLLAVLIADEAVARGARRWTTYVGCAFAAWAQWQLLSVLWLDNAPDPETIQPLRIFWTSLLYSILACWVYVNVRTARLAAERMRAAELARAKSRRRTLESRLQSMQARVEPQFLFNTLAQVRELHERDATMGGRMLDDLIAYLRAALPHLRESSSTLGQEIALARAYLDIMRVRLGERLTFEIDVPEAVKDARIPPMMLLPLIDHALVYGLQPGDAGGTIAITTQAEGGRLRLTISDSGVSFLPGTHAGHLENIAERLQALYGEDARFELERMRERGTRAILEFPYETNDRSDR